MLADSCDRGLLNVQEERGIAGSHRHELGVASRPEFVELPRLSKSIALNAEVFEFEFDKFGIALTLKYGEAPVVEFSRVNGRECQGRQAAAIQVVSDLVQRFEAPVGCADPHRDGSRYDFLSFSAGVEAEPCVRF